MTSNIDSAGLFLVNTLFSLYAYTLILRILLQWVRADFYNPMAQFVWKVTNPPTQLLRQVVPRYRQLDIPALVVLLPASAGEGSLAGRAGWQAGLSPACAKLTSTPSTARVRSCGKWNSATEAPDGARTRTPRTSATTASDVGTSSTAMRNGRIRSRPAVSAATITAMNANPITEATTWP